MRHLRVTRARILSALLLIPVTVGCGGKTDTPPTQSGPANTTPASTTQTPTSGGTKGAGPEVPAPPPAEDLTKAKPDVVFEAAKLTNELRENSGAFLEKYSGKVIEIGGKVVGYDQTSRGDTGRLFIGPGINIYECADPRPMTKAMPGQKVTLRGMCKPGLGVNQWTIVAVEGDPPPTVSAEQLAKEYKENEDKTAEKYRGKHLIVTGSIQELKKEIGTNVTLTPPGQKPAVVCFFGGDFERIAEQSELFKSGKSVRVLGEWVSGAPTLSMCVLLPPTK